MAILLHIEDLTAGNTFGERLRNARIATGLTAKEVADKIGVSYPAYMSYENKNKQPRQDKLVKISDVLNVSIDQLLGTSFLQVGQMIRGKLISFPQKKDIDLNALLNVIEFAVRSGKSTYDGFYDIANDMVSTKIHVNDSLLAGKLLDSIQEMKNVLLDEIYNRHETETDIAEKTGEDVKDIHKHFVDSKIPPANWLDEYDKEHDSE